MTTISLNGEAFSLDGASSIASLLARLGIDERNVAVERNRAIVSKSAYATTELAEGDQIEIVQFVGGG